MSTGHIKPELQRKQCSLYDNPFALRLAQRIIDAKIRNQLVVLRRYAKNDNIDIDENIKYMEACGNRIQKSAFEAKLTKKQYNKLLSVIPCFCGDKDSIRVYKLTGKCQITCWGVKDVTDEDEIVIV